MSRVSRIVCAIIGADHVTRALRILTLVVVILIVGGTWGANIVIGDSHDSHKAAAEATQLAVQAKQLAVANRTIAAQAKTIASRESTLEVTTCQRVNGVIDGVDSLVDGRGPSRRSAQLVLASKTATPIQRLSALTTISSLDAALTLFHQRFIITPCPSSRQTP